MSGRAGAGVSNAPDLVSRRARRCGGSRSLGLGRPAVGPGATTTRRNRIQGRVFNEFEEDGERVPSRSPTSGSSSRREAGEEVGEAHHRRRRRLRRRARRARAPTSCASTRSRCPRASPSRRARTRSRRPSSAATAARPRCSSSARTCATVEQQVGRCLPQTLANGLKLAMIIAITSVGLSLIFGTTGLSNFAHGEMVTFGALMAYLFNREIGWHLIPAAVLAVALVGAGRHRFELGVWRPLRRRKTSLTSMMIVSIGIALAARYLFLFFFGGGSRRTGSTPCSPIRVDRPASTWHRDRCGSSGSSALVIVAVALFLLKARFGKAIRAVSDNPDLASSSGIDTDRVILIVWALGGALAGLGGDLLRPGVRREVGHGLHAAAADVRGDHARRPRQPVRRPRSAASSSASSSSCGRGSCRTPTTSRRSGRSPS